MSGIRRMMIVAGLLSSDAASACSCVGHDGPRAELADADRVFSGRIEEVTVEGEGPHSVLRARIAVTAVWKGPDDAFTTLVTPEQQTACGLNLVRGEEWIFYASEGRLGPSAGTCDRSTTRIGRERLSLGRPDVRHDLLELVPTPLEASLLARDAGGVTAAFAAGASPARATALGTKRRSWLGRPLDVAIGSCAPDVVTAIMAAGIQARSADPAAVLTCDNLSAMMDAVGRDSVEWAQQLVKSALRGRWREVDALLDAGVDIHATFDGKTPLQAAEAAGLRSVARKLRKRGG